MTGYTLQEVDIYCPYCGEGITTLLNPEEVGSDYIEDCEVCCRPIEFHLLDDGRGGIEAAVRSEND
jgi:hypothetical protein